MWQTRGWLNIEGGTPKKRGKLESWMGSWVIGSFWKEGKLSWVMWHWKNVLGNELSAYCNKTCLYTYITSLFHCSVYWGCLLKQPSFSWSPLNSPTSSLESCCCTLRVVCVHNAFDWNSFRFKDVFVGLSDLPCSTHPFFSDQQQSMDIIKELTSSPASTASLFVCC